MIQKAEDLLRQVLALPVEDRADVAAEVIASLDEPEVEDPQTAQTAWAKEIERRARRVLSGESEGEPWPEVRDRIAQRLTQR